MYIYILIYTKYNILNTLTYYQIRSDHSLSHVRLFETPMNCSTPGLPVHHQLPDFTQTHVHRVSDAIQPSHPLSSPSPPALNPLPYVKQIASGKPVDNTGISTQCSVKTYRGARCGGHGREVPEGGDMCTLTADSHCCKAETNTTL